MEQEHFSPPLIFYSHSERFVIKQQWFSAKLKRKKKNAVKSISLNFFVRLDFSPHEL